MSMCGYYDYSGFCNMKHRCTNIPLPARKRLQKLEKKKRYNKNKKEKNLSNALENALNLGSTEETAEEDPVVDYIPPPNSIPLPFIPKPKKFELSFVKPAPTKEFLVVGGKASVVFSRAASLQC